MKKIFVSVGVVALGASTVHAASAALGGDVSKPWSVSATLRGFYDDNYTTQPKTGDVRESFGFSIRPSVSLNLPLDQTTLALRYIYGATWYADRTDLNSGNGAWDQSHQFEALLDHSFSERYTLTAKDSFVIAQEPELLATGTGPTPYLYRTKGNNIRNLGEITFNGALTRQLSLVLGYRNTFFDYENDGGTAANPSLSGLLDRDEHLALVNLRWQALPQTVGVLGYNYGQVNYSSDEAIGSLTTYGDVTSKSRDNRSHYVYAGVDQNFSKDLTLSLRGGAQWIEYYNDPSGDNKTTSPYADISLTYVYLPGSNLRVGFTHSRNQTDIARPTGDSLTVDQESSVVYASLHHRFDAKISGGLTAQWQNSEFSGGIYDGGTEDFLAFGVNLAYQFNHHLSSEIGYSFDKLYDSPTGRNYDRNRIYVGVTAAY